jgi:hypothetical protein
MMACTAQAHQGSVTITPVEKTASARSWQYFNVHVQNGTLKGKTSAVNSAFLSRGAVQCDVDEIGSCIKLKCEKGVFMDNIKQTLTSLQLTMTSYQEEYTSKEPTIFK